MQTSGRRLQTYSGTAVRTEGLESRASRHQPSGTESPRRDSQTRDRAEHSRRTIEANCIGFRSKKRAAAGGGPRMQSLHHRCTPDCGYAERTGNDGAAELEGSA